MLVLETIPHETIWGGDRLAALSKAGTKKIGHLYSVYAREGCSNRILNGAHRGKTLNDVFPEWKADLGMAELSWFPLTLALTEAGGHLSIQVHPDDGTARLLEGCARGKRESWYFLTAPHAGWIYDGCTCADAGERDRLLAAGRYLELADRLPVEAGDYVFVEPGTLHAITAGSLVYEIEEGADLTYRLYDHDRRDERGEPRGLQVEKAVRALELSRRSSVGRYPPSGEIWEQTYVTRKVSNASGYRNTGKTLECFTLIDGTAECGGCALEPGMSVLLWPGEEICAAQIRLGFAAWYRGDGL